MDSPAPTGKVTIHDKIILPTTLRLIAPMPLAKPTPNTAPTKVWVVDMGKPVPEAMTTVPAAANSAAKPRLGVNSVMALPTVIITLKPSIARPITIPEAPINNIQGGKIDLAAISPPL